MRPSPRSRASVLLVALASLVLAGCTASTSAAEPRTRAELIRVAAQFNRDYAHNRVGAVWDRFDPASRAVIARADYVRRHRECPTTPGDATILDATPAKDGAWLVRYSLDGVALVDVWHYRAGRWLFDLRRSNPEAVRLYRLSFRAYARAVGCDAAR